MAKYVLAVKREQRETIPADWLDQVTSTEGVQILDQERQYGIALIEATDTAVAKLRSTLGAYLHIEPERFSTHASSQPVPLEDLQKTLDALRNYNPTAEEREHEIQEFAKAEVENEDSAEGHMIEERTIKELEVTVDAQLPTVQNAISRLLPFVGMDDNGAARIYSYHRIVSNFTIDGPEGEVTIDLAPVKNNKRKTQAVITAENDAALEWAQAELVGPAIDSIVKGRAGLQ